MALNGGAYRDIRGEETIEIAKRGWSSIIHVGSVNL